MHQAKLIDQLKGEIESYRTGAVDIESATEAETKPKFQVEKCISG